MLYLFLSVNVVFSVLCCIFQTLRLKKVKETRIFEDPPAYLGPPVYLAPESRTICGDSDEANDVDDEIFPNTFFISC